MSQFKMLLYLATSHLDVPAVWLEKVNRLWEKLVQRLQGLRLVIHFKSVSRHTLERHYSQDCSSNSNSNSAQGQEAPGKTDF